MLIIKGRVRSGGAWRDVGRDEVLDRYAGATGNNGLKLFQNLLSYRDWAGASTVGGEPITDYVAALASLLQLRWICGKDGDVVLDRRSEDSARSLCRYLAGQGLVDSGAEARMVFAEDLLDYPGVLRTVASAGGNGYGSVRLVPYQQSSLLNQLARDAGVSLSGPGDDVIAAVVDRFSNKSNARDLVEEVFALGYPRVVLREGALPSEAELLRRIESAISYAEACQKHKPERGMLFAQFAVGAGGFANFTVRWDFGVEFPDKRVLELGTARRFASWLLSQAASRDIELTPYLPIVRSHSVGVLLRADFMGFIGEREQLLDERKSYEGFRVNLSNRDDEGTAALRRAASCISLHVAEKFHALGYYTEEGALFGIDFFWYLGPDGRLWLGVAEFNIRCDGTAAFWSLLAKLPAWRRALLAGKLSFEVRDHEKLSPSLSTVEGLLAALAEAGVPLASAEVPVGVLVLTSPGYTEDGLACMSVVAFLGTSDRERARMKALFRKVASEESSRRASFDPSLSEVSSTVY